MKNIFTLFILLFTAISVNAASYDLKIKGVQVTDANKNDVLGDGTVRYQDSNNVLVITNANISYVSSVIYVGSTMSKLFEIKFYGNNTLTSTSGHGIYYAGTGDFTLFSDVYAQGSLTINAKNTDFTAVDIVSKVNVKIQGITLTANGSYGGIATHLVPEGQQLTIKNSTVTATGDKCAMRFSKVNLTGCSYVSGYGIDGFNIAGYSTLNGSVTKTAKVKMTEYDISIAGVPVTSLNAENILVNDSKNKNKVSYNPTTNELTLNGVDINLTTGTSNAIFANHNNPSSTYKTFRIKLIGNNKITQNTGSNALYIAPLDVEETIIYSADGTGTLDVTNTNSTYGPLYTSSYKMKKMTFKDCTVNLTAKGLKAPAIEGDKTKAVAFSFVNANVNAESAGTDAFIQCGGVSYEGCFMKTPAEAFFSAEGKLTNNSKVFTVVKGTDNIKPFLYYGKTMSVVENKPNSVKVNFHRAMDNCTDCKNMKYHVYLQKGTTLGGLWTQSYDLDLNITSSLLSTILSKLEEGTTYTLRMRAMDEAGNTVFYDDLVFTTATNYAPIVSNKTVKYTAKSCSIALSWDAATDDFTPQDQLMYIVEYYKKGNSNTWYEKKLSETSYTIEELTPNTTYVICVYAQDEAKKKTAYKQIEVTTPIEEYNIMVCGEMLTSENLASYADKGVTYDYSTKVLTLENANLVCDVEERAAISFGLDKFTLNLKGTNTLSGVYAGLAVAFAELTITSSTGTGSLKCTSTGANSFALATVGSLTINNCSVEAVTNIDNGKGLYGFGASQLVIDNAYVKAYGKDGSLSDWNKFTLTNCHIAAPSSAVIGGAEADNNMGVYKNGAVVKGANVEIKKGASAINSVTADDSFNGNVYNVQGVKVDGNYKGILIKNGKKYLQK